MKPKYLYIFEDATFKQSDKEPIMEDLEAVEEGYLDIIKIVFRSSFISSDLYYYNFDTKEWTEVEKINP